MLLCSLLFFQVYALYFILKFNCNEFDKKPVFEGIRNWLNFRLRSFLCKGTLRQNVQAAVSYKLVSYIRDNRNMQQFLSARTSFTINKKFRAHEASERVDQSGL